jgi:DNA-binding NarL/FixJ family response regulator
MGIRVFIVDDHALVRAGMRMILSAQTDIEVIGEAETGEAALPLIRRLRPDIVLCDLHLPGLSGLEVTERLTRGGHGPRVIIVSVLEDGPMPRRLLEAGASGYVGKAGDAHELLDAIREVARGKRYLAHAVARGIALSGVVGSATPIDSPHCTRARNRPADGAGHPPERHRAAIEPESQDRQHPQIAAVRQARDRRHGGAGAHVEAARSA